MFTEIWDYMSPHYAPKADGNLSIKFGLPQEKEIQEISLEQFRRFAEESTRKNALEVIFFDIPQCLQI